MDINLNNCPFLLIKAQMLKVCRIPGSTACLKMVYLVCLKVAEWRKNPLLDLGASFLQPSDLQPNAYRCVPDAFFLLVSCICVHRNPREGRILSKHPMWN